MTTPIKINNTKDIKESIFANSFELEITNVKNFSGFNKNIDLSQNPQHKSAALYGSKVNENTYLELFTRDGFIINNNKVEKLEIPNFYDPHNSQGGIRGVFFIDEETLKVGSLPNWRCLNTITSSIPVVNLFIFPGVLETSVKASFKVSKLSRNGPIFSSGR